jgi:methanogenic corrinoid protein MtbC1
VSAINAVAATTRRMRDDGSRRVALLSSPALRRFRPHEDETQELARMEPSPSRETREKPPAECGVDHGAWPDKSPLAGSSWPSALAERTDAKQRMAQLAQTLEADVIPRLVGAHRPRRPAPPLDGREIEAFVELLRSGSDTAVAATVAALHQRGLPVENIFLGLLGPAARRLGELWEADRCDFSTVTIGLGRLQRLLREWSGAFGVEVEHPPNGRRILLAQHPDEQHSFGLSMVAEFFRRDGWEVLGGVGGAVADPSAQVSRDWFDAVGFSVGSQTRIDWLRERIAQVRASTCNKAVVVLVGGPLFVLQPGWAQSVGADAAGDDGGKAPRVAEDLLAARHVRR